MRMNPTRGLPAAAWLARTPAPELARWLAEHADEPQAVVLAQAIAAARPQTSLALAELVRDTLRRGPRRLRPEEVEAAIPRVFQAIRIAVND
jgi:16S rRNA (cytosine1402-N4)-methyltransferase